MSDAPERPDRPPETEAPIEDDAHPRGTFFLVIVFLVLIVLLWLWTYGVLLDRA